MWTSDLDRLIDAIHQVTMTGQYDPAVKENPVAAEEKITWYDDDGDQITIEKQPWQQFITIKTAYPKHGSIISFYHGEAQAMISAIAQVAGITTETEPERPRFEQIRVNANGFTLWDRETKKVWFIPDNGSTAKLIGIGADTGGDKGTVILPYEISVEYPEWFQHWLSTQK